ncbi:MAG: OmpA family protein, partial [Sphingomonadaceae bacterium]|nr:OmpA family protein [Sphingomonadaceae bacterium]
MATEHGRHRRRAAAGPDRTVSTAAIGCGALAAIVLVTGAAAVFFTNRLDYGPGVPASVAVANGPPPDYPIPQPAVTPAASAAARAPAVTSGATAASGPAAALPASPDAKPSSAAAPTSGIPAGAGVVGSAVAGKPQLSVYFATAKADIAPDFATAAAPVKAYLAAHTSARLHVSGFNDPRGKAAANAELSKHRAQAVAAALTKLGVPAGSIDLVKPAETTDATTSQAGARRVDVTVADG